MNKEQFLKELESRLKVLDQRERQDMLAEYSQHIDMKVESGMSEKEAIEDFGDIDSLVEELLEAYHIDPDFRVLETEEKSKGKESVRRKAGKVLGGKKNSFSGYLEQQKKRREERKASRKEKEKKNFFQNKKDQISSTCQVRRQNDEGKEWPGEVWKTMKSIVGWCVKLLLLLIAIPIIVVDLFAVFGLGVLLILLMQGYPLIGITIGVFGVVLCCSACGLIMLSYIICRRTDVVAR